MSWGNMVEDHCPQFKPTEKYYETIKDIELIEDEGERYGIIIAASMQAHAKIESKRFACLYVKTHLTTGDLAYFKQLRGLWWPWSGSIMPR